MAVMIFFERHMRKIEKFSFWALLGLVAFFLVWHLRFAENFPYALDDTRMYLKTFEDRFLDAEGWAKIKFFFSETNFPHTKLVGRSLATLHYVFTGTINFTFLIYIGVFALVWFIFLAKKTFNLKYLAVLPLALLLFAPGKMVYWIGPVTGYPFLLCLTLLSFWMLSKGKLYWAGAIAFVASFTHSPGIFVFLAAAPLFLVPPNKSVRRIGVWVLFFAITAFVYWLMVFADSPVSGVARQERSLSSIAACLPSLVVYEGQFLSLPILALDGHTSYVAGKPVLSALLTFLVGAGCLAIIWWKRNTFSMTMAVSLSFLLFCMLPGAISAFVSDDCASFSDKVAPRYIMYAMMAWAGIYLFVLVNSPKKFTPIIALLSSLALLPSFHSVNKDLYKVSEYQQYQWIQRITYNFGKKAEDRALQSAIDRGIYDPYLPEFLPAKAENEVPSGELEDIWYIFDRNADFCKVEFILKKEVPKPIEIWTEEDAKRFRPALFHVRLVRGRNRQRLNEKLKRTSNKVLDSYVYFTSDEAICEGPLYIRAGDKLSKTLVMTDVER